MPRDSTRLTPANVRRVCRLLEREFGPVAAADYLGNPLDELVYTILSQSTTAANTDRAFAALRKRCPRWDAVLAAPEREIARAIRHGGLANVKARAIRRALQLVKEREGRLSLRRLARMPVSDARRYLTSIPGVGPKTAACVLLFALGRPVFPVDTHVYRLTRRLGWLPPSVPFARAGEVLEPAIPPFCMLPLHLYLIWHGRATCPAAKPRCGSCALRARCRHGTAGIGEDREST